MSNNTWIVINYLLNRFRPYGIILFLLFTKFDASDFQPYCIFFFVCFIERFSFSAGHSIATYENNAEFRREVDKLKKDG
tara:strand:+ start:287 stop:523 length:237 start_codon:yes stop_codon:yes gene_type:complete